jgi:hypothetical protein
MESQSLDEETNSLEEITQSIKSWVSLFRFREFMTDYVHRCEQARRKTSKRILDLKRIRKLQRPSVRKKTNHQWRSAWQDYDNHKKQMNGLVKAYLAADEANSLIACEKMQKMLPSELRDMVYGYFSTLPDPVYVIVRRGSIVVYQLRGLVAFNHMYDWTLQRFGSKTLQEVISNHYRTSAFTLNWKFLARGGRRHLDEFLHTDYLAYGGRNLTLNIATRRNDAQEFDPESLQALFKLAKGCKIRLNLLCQFDRLSLGHAQKVGEICSAERALFLVVYQIEDVCEKLEGGGCELHLAVDDGADFLYQTPDFLDRFREHVCEHKSLVLRRHSMF